MRAWVGAAIGRFEKQGVQAEGFRVRAREGDHVCTPFEKSHTDAVDVDVADCNGDGRIDLVDACAFAASLQAMGNIGVFGVQTPTRSRFWVHVGSGSRRDRWGEMRRVASDGKTEIQPVQWSQNERTVRQRLAALDLPRSSLRLEIQKQPTSWKFNAQAQALTLHPTVRVFGGAKLLKAFPSALGYDAVNDKEKRGDYRTPEGRFYICGFNERSQYYKSLRLSYPNQEDAARGLKSGLIDRSTHDAIARAIRRQVAPPQDTRLGGDIMIHGGGNDSNWTWGCVALPNADIDELFDLLPFGTPVTIRK